MKRDSHGVNLFELQRKYHFDVDEIMDFSSNINPLGPSKKALDHLKENLDRASVYPDPNYVDLKDTLAGYTHIEPEMIVLGAGTTNLIRNYIRYVDPERALINSPCYSEYENELNLIGAEIFEYKLDYYRNFTIDVDYIIDYIKENKIELYVITNPNNPTGTILNRTDIERIQVETGVNILIDETYIEFTDKSVYSAAPLAVKNPGLFVIRSTSKFFSTPGIRLGYGITGSDEVYEAMNQDFALWDINVFADMMGQVMFKDEEYKSKTFNHIQTEKEKMISALEKIPDIKVFPSYANFVLCKILKEGETAEKLRNYLLPKKLVIRDCASFKNLDKRFFRFCILSTDANDQLLEGIQAYFNGDEEKEE